MFDQHVIIEKHKKLSFLSHKYKYYIYFINILTDSNIIIKI